MRKAMTFRYQCMATPEDVRQLLAAFDGFLLRAHIHREQAENLRIVAAEALNNVAEHAYAGRNSGKVGFLCAVGEAGVICRISDRGGPLDQLPEGLAPDLSGSLPEGGFGWFLIRQLATHIRYQRKGARNLLSFAIKQDEGNRTAP